VTQGGLRTIRFGFNELPEQWEISEHQSKHHDNFRQTLTYLGHDSNKIRVLYQEFTNEMIKDKFSLEIEYDLSEGPTFGFRGARIEVLNADNRSLEYRVLEPFPNTALPYSGV
jgi:hypothetical protein